MFHKRLLKEFSDNRKYVAGMVIMQWAALLANVALMYVLAAYVGRISGIVKGRASRPPRPTECCLSYLRRRFLCGSRRRVRQTDVLSCVHAGEARLRDPDL